MIMLGCDIGERNSFVHCFNKHKHRAGKDWFFSFMKKHRNLSMHKPEATSLDRSSGFNKEAVGDYFKTIEKVLDQNKFPATRIYNVDETGLSTVQKCQKVLVHKGNSQDRVITSRERGVNTTWVVCASAPGNYVPRSSETFIIWLKHVISTVKPSIDNKVVQLLLDGHSTHSESLDAIIVARDAGVIMLSFPRTSHTNYNHSTSVSSNHSKPTIDQEKFRNG